MTTALAQAFYLSPQFRSITFETRDWRLHPVLGGISSTRWFAYDRFLADSPRLVERLDSQQPFERVVQLADQELDGLTAPGADGVTVVSGPDHRLPVAGLMAGNAAANALYGSHASDVLLGLSGPDRLIGRDGNDVLSGGAGPDEFIFGSRQRQNRRLAEHDEITDFQGGAGDRIVIRSDRKLSITQSVFTGRRGEVLVTTWAARLAPSDVKDLEDWMVQGSTIEIDFNGNQTTDLLIALPGVGSVDPAWLDLG